MMWCYTSIMRTTLDLENDVLAVLKERAALEGRSMGTVASKLIAQALQALPPKPNGKNRGVVRNGFVLVQRPQTPKRNITLADIEAIAQAEGV